MKKYFVLLLLYFICFVAGFSQEQKKVSILGDSYSTFQGYLQPDTNAIWYLPAPQNRNDVIEVEQTWWYKFIKDNNLILEVNNSFSGATICNTGYKKSDYSDRSFITRMNNLGNPDIIFIFGATNDSWAKSPIGEYKYDSWTTQELYTFRPAMAYMFDQMSNMYPTTKLYFILNSELNDSINESARIICQHYQIDCIELHDIEKQKGHPSIAGMDSISQQLKSYIFPTQ